MAAKEGALHNWYNRIHAAGYGGFDCATVKHRQGSFNAMAVLVRPLYCVPYQ
jgi:hypothetical protein